MKNKFKFHFQKKKGYFLMQTNNCNNLRINLVFYLGILRKMKILLHQLSLNKVKMTKYKMLQKMKIKPNCF